MSYPERIIPDETEPGIVAAHLKRYAFAGRSARRETSLMSLRSGLRERRSGRGRSAPSAWMRARRQWRTPAPATAATTSSRGHGRSASIPGRTLTPSALRDDRARRRSKSALPSWRGPAPEGALIVSTPHAAVTTRAPANPFHAVELSRADFEGLLRRHFADVTLYGQRRLQTRAHRLAQRLDVLGLRRRLKLLRRGARWLGTAPTAEMTLADLVIDRASVDNATELVAVCRRPRRP